MVQTTADDRVPVDAEERQAPLASWLDRSFDLGRLRAEPCVWLLVIPMALLLRLVWLADWPLTASEAAAASASWSLVTRGVVEGALPANVGPAVVLLGSFWTFLFGASDTTARLGSALAGAGMVAATWWLRPWLGHLGALVAAIMLSVSPLMLYETRRLTGEGLAVLGLLVLLIAILQRTVGGGRGALMFGAAGLVIATFSHFLALPIAILLIALAPVTARMAVGAGQADDAKAGRTMTRADWMPALATALVLTGVIILLSTLGGPILMGHLLNPLTAWGALPAIPGASPFFPMQLLFFYAPLMLTGAVLAAAMVGSSKETVAERQSGLLIVFWAIVALPLAAIAGDRGPAQTLYPLLPLILLAGRAIAGVITGIDWTAYLKQRGPVLSGVSALALIAFLLCASALSGLNSTVTSMTPILQAGIYFLLGVLLAVATVYLIRPFNWVVGGRIVGLTLIGLFALYEIRSATQLAYVQPAEAVEMAVQQQPTPGLLAVVDRIHRLSRDVTGPRRSEADLTGGHSLEIAIDRSLSGTFEWYLRDYPQRTVFDAAETANAVPGNAQLVIVSADTETALRASLDRGYVGQKYPFSWSYPAAGAANDLRGFVRFLLYREVTTPAPTRDFSVYLRRDVADRVLFKGSPGASEAAPPAGLFDQAGRGRGAGQFDAPRGIAIDGEGNILIVDTVNTRIQKFDARGTHLWSSGTAGPGPGQFGRVQNGPGPTGIAVDEAGFIYVADTWNHRVVKLDPTGKFVTSWGGFVNTQGNQELGRQHPREFYGPRSLAIGPDRALYVTDTGNKRVLVFDLEGKPLRQWGGIGTGPDNLNEPVGIAVDKTGIVYVADTYNGRVAVFDSQGQPKLQWSVPGWAPGVYQEPYLAVAGNMVYLTSGPGRNLLTYDSAGKLLAEQRRFANRDFNVPTGVAVGPDGSVLVVDTGANTVVRAK